MGPAFSYELSTIIKHGIHEMYDLNKDIVLCAVYNENYPMPAKPKGIDEGIVKGLTNYAKHQKETLH